MHITSRGRRRQLETIRMRLDAIEAILPAGTLSGAPKITGMRDNRGTGRRAPRGIYGGAIGYIDFTGNTWIPVSQYEWRLKRDNKVFVQAGGGIVADSIPEKEYEESENKAKAVIEAIMKASDINEF